MTAKATRAERSMGVSCIRAHTLNSFQRVRRRNRSCYRGRTLSTDLRNGMDEWMDSAFADHLDLARCSALIAEAAAG